MPPSDSDSGKPARSKHDYDTGDALGTLGDLLGPGPSNKPEPEPEPVQQKEEVPEPDEAPEAPEPEDDSATEIEAEPEEEDADEVEADTVDDLPISESEVLEADDSADVAVANQRYTRPTPGFRAPSAKSSKSKPRSKAGKSPQARAAAQATPSKEAAPDPRPKSAAPSKAPRPAPKPAAKQRAQVPHPDPEPAESTEIAPRVPLPPGVVPLLPSEPLLGLSDLLSRDAIMNVPKWRLGRVGVAAAGLLGLLLSVIGAARYRAGVDVPLMGPIRLGHLGLILAMLALWGFLAIRAVAGDKVLRIPLAPSQGDQWEEVQSQARLMQFGQWVGIGGAVLGLGILALSLRYIRGPGVVVGAGLGGTMAAASIILLVVMEARRGPLRAVYVQTLMLSRLEQAGVSSKLAVDPRTAEVLRSLDQLLAELPESAVRKFMSTEQAQMYLDLLEKANRGGAPGRR